MAITSLFTAAIIFLCVVAVVQSYPTHNGSDLTTPVLSVVVYVHVDTPLGVVPSAIESLRASLTTSFTSLKDYELILAPIRAKTDDHRSWEETHLHLKSLAERYNVLFSDVSSALPLPDI